MVDVPRQILCFLRSHYPSRACVQVIIYHQPGAQCINFPKIFQCFFIVFYYFFLFGSHSSRACVQVIIYHQRRCLQGTHQPAIRGLNDILITRKNHPSWRQPLSHECNHGLHKRINNQQVENNNKQKSTTWQYKNSGCNTPANAFGFYSFAKK